MRKYHWAGLVALAFTLIACMAPPCPAVNYHYENELQTEYGQAIQGAEVYVYKANSRTEATVYSDLAGSTALTQPIETSSEGEFGFYVGAGIYDLIWSHSAWALSDSMVNLRFGYADSASGFTLEEVTADSGDISGTLKSDVLRARYITGLYDNAYAGWPTPNAPVSVDSARIYHLYTRRIKGPNDPAVNLSIEKHHHGRRAPAVMAQGSRCGKLKAGGYNFHFGTLSSQMPEMMMLSREHASYGIKAESLGIWTGEWDDRGIFYWDEQDTTVANSYNKLVIANDRGDSSRWLPRKVVGDPDNGWAGPAYGIRLQSDLPDSGTSTTYARDLIQVRWAMTRGDALGDTGRQHINNPYSSLLTMYEHNTPQYAFRRDAVQMWAHQYDRAGAIEDTTLHEKYLQFNADGTGGTDKYTKMGHYPDSHGPIWADMTNQPSYFLWKVCNSKMVFRGSAAGAPYDVELEYYLADVDTLYDSGGADIAGSLDVDGPVTADGNVTLGDATTDVTTVTGELEGGLVMLVFTENVTDAVVTAASTRHLYAAGLTPADYVELPMPAAGSLVGMAARCNVDSKDASAALKFVVEKNNAAWDTLLFTPASTGWQSHSESIARGGKTFSAGDGISMGTYASTDTLQIDRPALTLLFQLDD